MGSRCVKQYITEKQDFYVSYLEKFLDTLLKNIYIYHSKHSFKSNDKFFSAQVFKALLGIFFFFVKYLLRDGT